MQRCVVVGGGYDAKKKRSWSCLEQYLISIVVVEVVLGGR